ncbi:hypothetical protein [Streptomyces sp. NBRC 109706]|uniref:hypothetical protein n=1 Tax=Streptomyces sp. NBRC 109706 TaxID=1550035 RepID=UPI00131E7D38|nr:hypothetical protein [Streptomyces sp. NBRC 109706]
MDYRYEIRVPTIANAETGWEKPVQSGSETWTASAHSFGRHVLNGWLTKAEERYAGHPAVVEVWGEDPPGAYAVVTDPGPVAESVKELERAIEAKQIADLAADMATDTLAEAMQDARRFDDLSANKVALLVRHVMSRPTALKLLRRDEKES